VLRGEMSLVGPRPVIEQELLRYGDNIVYYVESTPGLTGLWQISGRNDVDYRRRVHLDCWYVRNWSLWYDLVILLKTPRAVLRGLGAY
jgi:lipopolysaccharide/colanic/teichoic acid biosynthesis glycosyltransferase